MQDTNRNADAGMQMFFQEGRQTAAQTTATQRTRNGLNRRMAESHRMAVGVNANNTTGPKDPIDGVVDYFIDKGEKEKPNLSLSAVSAPALPSAAKIVKPTGTRRKKKDKLSESEANVYALQQKNGRRERNREHAKRSRVRKKVSQDWI